MTIYLDIVFFENLCMNYIILFATGYILKIKMKHIRIIFSSILGSGYAVLIYIQDAIFYSNIVIKILLSIVMILTAFYPKKIKLFFKELVLFYLVSFVFGGCAFALLYFVKPQNILMRNGVYVGKYPIQIALLGGIVGFVMVEVAFRLVKNKMTKKDMFADLYLYSNETEVKVKALVDSGNMLKDPISGLPVIVVEKEELYKIFSKKILDNTENIINGEFSNELYQNEADVISKFRMIPFTSLGKQNGLLLGIKTDKVKICFAETEEVVTGVIIGIYDKTLTKNGEYKALVGLDITERRAQDEFTSNIKIEY